MSITTLVRRIRGVPRYFSALGGSLLGATRATHPFPPLAARTAAVSAGILGALALGGASIRILPWLLDPRVPWRMALPFGRAVASVALEAAVLVGWPIGWALAAFVLIERGEARVLALLGERPVKTTSRLVPMTLLFGAALAAAAVAGGRDASEPGRVLADLLRAGRVSCTAASEPTAVDVPLLGAAWLCAHARDPRLVGHPPHDEGSLYSARVIDVAPDARRIELEDASFAGHGASIHVKQALFHLPPFVRASSLPAPWRAAFLAMAGAASGLLAVWLLLAMDQRALTLWRFHALLVGAAGPVSALAILHVLERAQVPAPLALYGALPVAAAVATVSVALLVTRLPGVRAAATK